MSPYEVLDVPTDAEQEEIKAAYRQRSRETRPDHGGDTEEFKKVTEAFELIATEEKRRYYDRHGSAWRNERNDLEHEMATLLVMAFEQSDGDPFQDIRDAIVKEKRGWEKRLKDMENAVGKIRRRLDKLLLKKSKAEKITFVEEVLEGRIKQIHDQMDGGKEAVEKCDRKTEFLEGLELQEEKEFSHNFSSAAMDFKAFQEFMRGM